MKKMAVALLVLCMLGWPGAAVLAETADGAVWGNTIPSVLLEGTPAAFENPPFIVEGTTLAPAIPYLSMLGFAVEWDEAGGTLAAEKNGLRLVFAMDAIEAQIATGAGINHQPLLQAPRVISGIPYVPLRFAAEMDGRKVDWYGEDRVITIGPKENGRTVRILVPQPPSADGAAFSGLFEKLGALVHQQTGIRIDWIVAPADSYQDRLNVMIASGDLPHIGFIPDPSVYPADIFPFFAMELSEVIGQYPNLARLPLESREDAAAPDGGLYGVPKAVSPADAPFPAVRQDWLDVLGLDVPETMDELYEVLKSFARTDPDGDGRNDTFGLTGSYEGRDAGSLVWVERVFNESPTRFKREGNAIIDAVTQEGTREALLWLNRAYADGLIDPDFAAKGHDRALHAVESEQAGIMAMTMAETWRTQAALRKTSDKALLTPLVSLKADEDSQPVTAVRPAHAGMFFISKQLDATEQDQALTVLDAILSPEMEAAADAEMEELIEAVFGVNELHELPAPRIPAADRKKAEDILDSRHALADPAAVSDSEIMAKLDNELKAEKTRLDQEIFRMKVKVITGAVPIEEWDNFIRKLQAVEGYQKMMEAINRPSPDPAKKSPPTAETP